MNGFDEPKTAGGRVSRLHRAAVGLCVLGMGAGLLTPSELAAQGWRGRAYTRVQYVEARPLIRDSVAFSQTSVEGSRRVFSGSVVTCPPAGLFCYFYGAGEEISTAPVVQDLDLSVWGFGVEGLRAFVSTRLRTAVGEEEEEFWPRTTDNFDLITGYLELNRSRYRIRLGRDYQVSGLGYYGYDGGSVEYRLPGRKLELEAYGGWGLARGLPEPTNSDEFASLGVFQPQDRNLLLGFRASARPIRGSSIQAIYQREIETDRSDLTSERIGLEANYNHRGKVSFRGHADYDVATGWWGKAGASVGWNAHERIYVEGRVLRYRPVFSLQTIWVVFSPTPYNGYGLAVGVRPLDGLAVRIEGDRREYQDTDAEVPFQVTTDRVWRFGASGSFKRSEKWDVSGGYWLNFSFGAALSAGQFQINLHPTDKLSLGGRLSAFQQLEEFRVGEGRVWGVGGQANWETGLGTIWASVDRYRHDRRNDPLQPDWTQTRASMGIAVYLGSEPGRLW